MRRRRNLPPAGKIEFFGWIGFVSGEPSTEFSTDGYDSESSIVQFFILKRDAMKRYGDVRKVRVTWERR